MGVYNLFIFEKLYSTNKLYRQKYFVYFFFKFTQKFYILSLDFVRLHIIVGQMCLIDLPSQARQMCAVNLTREREREDVTKNKKYQNKIFKILFLIVF